MRIGLAKSLCIILALGWGGVPDAHAKTCSKHDAESADAAVDVLDSWTKLAWAVKKFGHCDAGSIAEGNSEAVARLLVDHWNTLPLLVKLVRRGPALKRFVLRHIDKTLDTDDLHRIQSLASSQCPEGSGPLCGELRRAAARASP
jgi:hypothetical protein